MKAKVENISAYRRHFAAELGRARRIARDVSFIGGGLDVVAAHLQKLFPGFMVYRGGSHVSLHSADGEPRLMIVTE